MASDANDALSFRPMGATEDDLERFRDCFTRNGSTRTREHLKWQYLANPTGKLFVDLAVPAANPDTVCAIYASQPVVARIRGRLQLALQSLDTLTDAEYRGKGLFVTLAKSVFARATTDGAAFIYGFPNGNSAPGFFRKLGWRSLDPIPFLIRPLRIKYALDRLRLEERVGRIGRLASHFPNLALPLGPSLLPAGVRITEVQGFDERHTALWHRTCADVVGVERDARYLDWRIFKKPDGGYRVLAAMEGERLLAWTAYCLREKHGGRIGYVMELMHDVGQTRAARALLTTALRDLRDGGADAALAFCFSHAHPRSAFNLAGFLPLPERLRPIELHFGARAFDATLATDVEARAHWHISYLDSDTV